MQYRPRNNDWRSSQLILGSIKRSDGSFTEIGEQTLVCLIEAHFTGFKAEIGDTNLNEKEILCHMDKIRWVIKYLDSYKSADPDGIYPVLLQRAKETVIVPLTKIARDSLTFGCKAML